MERSVMKNPVEISRSLSEVEMNIAFFSGMIYLTGYFATLNMTGIAFYVDYGLCQYNF